MDGGSGMTVALFGWDHQTWMRAFAWAGVEPVRVSDPARLTGEEWDALTAVHSKWMESGGPADGPRGSIIL
jgi:hypothetical protein